MGCGEDLAEGEKVLIKEITKVKKSLCDDRNR